MLRPKLAPLIASGSKVSAASLSAKTVPFPANASSISRCASLIPVLTETSMTRFPANLSEWTSLSAAIMTASACLISSAVNSFSIPICPWVSTLIVMPFFLAACSNASCAM